MTEFKTIATLPPSRKGWFMRISVDYPGSFFFVNADSPDKAIHLGPDGNQRILVNSDAPGNGRLPLLVPEGIKSR